MTEFYDQDDLLAGADRVQYVDRDGYLVDEHGRYVDHDGRLLEGSRPEHEPDDGSHRGAPPPADQDSAGHDVGGHDRAGPDVADHEYVALPAPSRSGHKLGLVLLVVVGLLVTVAGGAYLWYRRQVDPGGHPGPAVAVRVPEGSSTSQIGSLLADRGVISNAMVFSFYSSQHGVGTFRAGNYVFRKHSSVPAAIKVLKVGPVVPKVVKVTIPEGFRVAQIADRLSTSAPQIPRADVDQVIRAGNLRSRFQPAGQPSLEGMLFPATYDVGDKASAVSTLTEMVATEDRVLTEVGVEQGTAALVTRAGRALTPYEVVTVASLIQSEAGNDAEMPKIATVIYNRLRAGKPLGIDATSRYESIQTGKPTNFDSSSPYNTRRRAGLPPTPISAPGRSALEAALHPADGPWTYYVLQAPGVHFFTDSTAEFDRAARECKAKGLGCG